MSAGGSSTDAPIPSLGAESRSSLAAFGITNSTASSHLPSSSYDGAHLDWKQYRRNILAPHCIRVSEEPPSHPLPESLVALIEASNADIGYSQQWRLDFRQQVAQMQGFDPSPVFPPNLLPPIDHEPQLAQCMLPIFNREALPKTLAKHKRPSYILSSPRPSLVFGFSDQAFTTEELSKIARSFVVSGTVVKYDTGSISAGMSLYIPFLVFERTFGRKGDRLEAANNQCAIAGAWCTHSMQMFYAQARSPLSPGRPEIPVSFSCTIDNDIAIVNYHWIDHAQIYCMSPVRKFNLSNDKDFDQFNIWVEAIGQWGLRTLLPITKNGLSLMEKPLPTAAEPLLQESTKLKLDTLVEKENLIIALKTTFGSIPWKMEANDVTAVSSSIASWGSPIIDEVMESDLRYQQFSHAKRTSAGTMMNEGRLKAKPREDMPTELPILEKNTCDIDTPKPLQALGPDCKPQTPQMLKTLQTKTNTEPHEQKTFSFLSPELAVRAELVWHKRLSHAMDEIQSLRKELEGLRAEVNNSNSTFQTEFGGIKNTIDHLLSKGVRTYGLSLPCMPDGRSNDQSDAYSSYLPTDMPFTISPYEASPSSFAPDSDQNLDIQSHSALNKILRIDAGVAQIISSRSTPYSSVAPSPSSSIMSDTTEVIVAPPAPPSTRNMLKCCVALFSTQFLGTFISSSILRMIFLGCVTDFALLAWASPHWPSSVAYFMSLFSDRR